MPRDRRYNPARRVIGCSSNILQVPTSLQVSIDEQVSSWQLPDNWLYKLCELLTYYSEYRDTAFWYDKIKDKHIPHKDGGGLTNYLKFIYRELNKNHQEDSKKRIAQRLADQINHCTAGFAERCQNEVSGLQIPKRLDELLCLTRNVLLDSFADNYLHKTGMNTGEGIHNKNHLLQLAAKLGCGISGAPKQHLTYGCISNKGQAKNEINALMQQAFQLYNLVDLILDYTERYIFLQRYGIDVNDTTELRDPDKYSVVCDYFFDILEDQLKPELVDDDGDRDDSQRFFKLLNWDDQYQVESVNWTYIRQLLWNQLLWQGYIEEPIVTEASEDNEELTKTVYYLIGCARNNPQMLGYFCQFIDQHFDLSQAVKQALQVVADNYINYLPSLITQLKEHVNHDQFDRVVLTLKNEINQLCVTDALKDPVDKKNREDYIKPVLLSIYETIGENGLKEWLMAQDPQQNKPRYSIIQEVSFSALHQFIEDYVTSSSRMDYHQRFLLNSCVSRDQSINTPLHMAVQYLDFEDAKFCWNQVLRFWNNYNKESPLHVAIKHNKFAIFAMIITRIAPKDLNNNVPTLLHLATELGREQFVDTILAKNMSINSVNNAQQTPAQLAVMYGREQILSKFLQKPNCAACFIGKEHGKVKATNLFHTAARYDQPNIINTLLQSLKSPQVAQNFLFSADEDGLGPLTVAVKYESLQVINQYISDIITFYESNEVQNLLKPVIEYAVHNRKYGALKTILQGSKNHFADKVNYLNKAINSDNSDSKIVATFIQCGWHASDNYGQLMHNSIENSRPKAVEALLTLCSDADINYLDHNGYMPLEKAAIRDDRPVIQLLLEKEAQLTKHNHDMHPVVLAVKRGYKALVELLLERDSTCVNQLDSEGYGLLELAAKHNHKAIIKILLDCDIKLTTAQYHQLPLVYQAAYLGYPQIIEALYEQDSAAIKQTNTDSSLKPILSLMIQRYLFESKSDNNKTIIQTLIQCGANLSTTYSAYPLCHQATWEGGHQALEVLVELGDNNMVNQVDDNSRTPLACLAQHLDTLTSEALESKKQSYLDVINILDQQNAHLGRHYQQEGSIIHQAAAAGFGRLIELLLKQDPNAIYQTNEYGDIPLHCAARYGQVSAIEVLCNDNSTQLDQTNSAGLKPFHEAIKAGYALEFFYLHQGNFWSRNTINYLVNQKTRDGLTPLLYQARICYSTNVFKILWANGANPKAKDQDGNNLLHQFVKAGDTRLTIDSINNIFVIFVNNHQINDFYSLLCDTNNNGLKPLDQLVSDNDGKRMFDSITPDFLTTKYKSSNMLQKAILSGSEDFVRAIKNNRLIWSDIRWNTPYLTGMQDIHYACQYKQDNASNIICLLNEISQQYLYRFQTSLLRLPDLQNNYPAHYAADNLEQGSAIIATLQQLGKLEYSMPNDEGDFPIHKAALRNNSGVIQQLLEAGDKPDTPNRQGVTPLVIATQHNYCSSMRVLMEHMKIKQPDLLLLLDVAIKHKHCEATQLLVEQDSAIVNKEDSYNADRTLLHKAVYVGANNIVDLLLDKGANCNITDQYGKKPYQLATDFILRDWLCDNYSYSCWGCYYGANESPQVEEDYIPTPPKRV